MMYMSIPSRKTLYRKAVDKWGLNLQLGMLMEESAELIKATNKYVRKSNKENAQNLAEELADVEIMIEQIKIILSWENMEIKVQEFKESKLKRLKEILYAN